MASSHAMLSKPLAAFLALLGSPAFAATCAPYERMVTNLGRIHGEVGVQSYISRDQFRITYRKEIWQNKEAGTLTILQIAPTGIACIIEAGTNLEFMPVRTVTEGDPL